MKPLFPDIETTIKIKLGNVFAKPNQRHNRREQINLNGCDNERCTFTQFLQIQKKSVIRIAGTFGKILQCITCVWFQQCIIFSQFNSMPSATYFC